MMGSFYGSFSKYFLSRQSALINFKAQKYWMWKINQMNEDGNLFSLYEN